MKCEIGFCDLKPRVKTITTDIRETVIAKVNHAEPKLEIYRKEDCLWKWGEISSVKRRWVMCGRSVCPVWYSQKHLYKNPTHTRPTTNEFYHWWLFLSSTASCFILLTVVWRWIVHISKNSSSQSSLVLMDSPIKSGPVWKDMGSRDLAVFWKSAHWCVTMAVSEQAKPIPYGQNYVLVLTHLIRKPARQ